MLPTCLYHGCWCAYGITRVFKVAVTDPTIVPQVNARMKQYEDELARKRMMADHELQRQRNAEMVKLQEDAGARQEQERLRVEQQIQAERRSAESYAVRDF